MTSTTLLLSDGTRATVLEAGAGPVVLLIHGVGMCAAAWRPQISALSKDRRVVAVNMPGHGGSDQLPSGARLPGYVAWAARVIEALECGAVSVAGHSMGALIAMGLAVERPDLVLRIAVLNGVHQRGQAARAAVEKRAAEIAEGVGDMMQPLTRWFGDDPASQTVKTEVAGWLSAVDRAGYAAAYRAFAEGDDIYADKWGQICCPALVLTGELDANSTPEMTRTMAAAAPLGRAVVIEGHRHMVNLTAPERVTDAMQTWLGREGGAA